MTSAALDGCQDACHKLEKEQIFGELWKAVRTNEETEEESTTLKNNKTALILTLIGTEFALACNRQNNEEIKLSEPLWLTTLPRNLSPILLLRCNDNHQNKFTEQTQGYTLVTLFHCTVSTLLASVHLHSTRFGLFSQQNCFPPQRGWSCQSKVARKSLDIMSLAVCIMTETFFFVTLHTFVSAGNREWLSAGRPDTPSCCGVVLSALCNFPCNATHLVV